MNVPRQVLKLQGQKGVNTIQGKTYKRQNGKTAKQRICAIAYLFIIAPYESIFMHMAGSKKFHGMKVGVSWHESQGFMA